MNKKIIETALKVGAPVVVKYIKEKGPELIKQANEALEEGINLKVATINIHIKKNRKDDDDKGMKVGS